MDRLAEASLAPRPARLKPWLVAVAANEARKMLKRQRRQPVIEIEIEPDPSPESNPAHGIGYVDLAKLAGGHHQDERKGNRDDASGSHVVPDDLELRDQALAADGVQHFREVDFKCTMRTDDPRVSGTHTSGAWNVDWWGEADLSSGALVQWGTPRLENAGGTWEGTGSGVYSSDRGDTIAFWYRGIGGYAGLAYFEMWTGQEPWEIQGQIFPGDPPTP